MKRAQLLHYGLQRSGTNFLEALLRRRFQVKVMNDPVNRRSITHKHARLYPDKNLVPEPQYTNDLHVPGFSAFEAQLAFVPDAVVVVSKDPYSWFLSYKKFAERCSWPTPQHHYIEEYNAFYGAFLSFAEQSTRFHFVRYIDLLTHSEAVMADLQDSAGLPLRKRARMRLPRKVKVSGLFDEQAAQRYRDATYMNELDESTLAQINEVADPAVVTALGYTFAQK